MNLASTREVGLKDLNVGVLLPALNGEADGGIADRQPWCTEVGPVSN